MKHWIAAGLMGLAAGSSVAGEVEFEIVLYLQPDGTGQSTENKSVELDEGELTIEESGETRNRYDKRDATAKEAAAIEAFIMTAFQTFAFRPTEDVPYPHVEVQVEFKTGASEAEITRIYPSGALPAEVMEIQDAFFNDRFD